MKFCCCSMYFCIYDLIIFLDNQLFFFQYSLNLEIFKIDFCIVQIKKSSKQSRYSNQYLHNLAYNQTYIFSSSKQQKNCSSNFKKYQNFIVWKCKLDQSKNIELISAHNIFIVCKSYLRRYILDCIHGRPQKVYPYLIFLDVPKELGTLTFLFSLRDFNFMIVFEGFCKYLFLCSIDFSILGPEKKCTSLLTNISLVS
eukprot:TRINITY_DN775_c1_g2_i2.p1 TRINITY_DN775_c1_g2~~TRINITY_DN775_c1_g2_i2.p1  ORF type:complete len:198 (-),score=-14.47 TRINITY_DN775_c1_g2_i2:91-684(-)